MPSRASRRTFLRTTVSVGALGVAGCLGGGSDSDHVFLKNGMDTERVLSVLVRADGDRVDGGRFRLPAGAVAGLRRTGFEPGTYTVFARVEDDPWQSATWEAGSCESAEDRDVVVSLHNYQIYIEPSSCEAAAGGLGGGGGSGFGGDAVEADEYRIGDVSETPAE